MINFRRLRALTYEFWFWTLVSMNVVLILGVLTLHFIASRENGLGGRFPPVDAMERSGHRFVLSHEEPCWTVRYTASQCPACQKDLANNWPILRQVLIGRGCRIYYVQPSIFAASTPDNSGSKSEMNLWAVGPSFVADSRLFATPTTVLLDSGARIIWRHIGVLSNADVRAATRSIPANDTSRSREVSP